MIKFSHRVDSGGQQEAKMKEKREIENDDAGLTLFLYFPRLMAVICRIFYTGQPCFSF